LIEESDWLTENQLRLLFVLRLYLSRKIDTTDRLKGKLEIESIKKILLNFGFTDKEVEIYVILAKHGVMTGGEISKHSKMKRPNIYRILKSLQQKGVVEQTLEAPTRFSSVPFEKILDKNIRIKQEEAIALEKAKKVLLNDWDNISSSRIKPEIGKFFVIEGNRKIYSNISRMMRETKGHFLAILSVTDLVRNEQYGVLDEIHNHQLKKKIKFHFLTELSSKNLKAMKLLISKLESDLELKGINQDYSFAQLPRMIIRDSKEVLFFISPKSEIFRTGQNESVICTNNQSLVQTLEGIFEDLWKNSVNIKNQILEIETGKFSLKPLRTKTKFTTPDYEKALTQVKEFTKELPLLNTQLERIVNAQPSFVGRAKELEQLKELADKALRRNGNTIFISGEAGIGKTRLLNEVVSHAKAQNFTVLEHRCSYESSIPFLPIRRILENLFKISSEDTNEVRKNKIVRTIEETAPEVTGLIPEIENFIPNQSIMSSSLNEDESTLESSGMKRFFDSTTELVTLAQILSAFSKRKPLMIIIDDLHFADSSTLKLFRNLAGAIEKSCLFLVGAYRQEAIVTVDSETKQPFYDFFQNVKGEVWYYTIELSRFDVEDTATLIKELLGIDSFLLTKQIQTATEGNPFFILETLKFLITRKLLRIKDNKWALTEDLNDINISPRIYDLVTRRIDLLREDERDVLDCASVIGDEFTSDAIQEITGLDRLRLLKKLNRVERKYQLIHSTENRFRFDHSKIREVLYKEINPELRKEYHSLIAQQLENQDKNYSTEELHKIAYHYSNSIDREKAVPYLLKVGKRSEKEFAVFETIQYYTQALELMNNREEWVNQKIEIFESLGNLYAINAEHEKANECYLKILAITDDEITKARVQRKIRQKRIVENNGVKLAYFIYGEGKKTIIFHSWRGSAEIWMPQVAYFSQNYKVITLDMRGTGESDKPSEEYTMDKDVDDFSKVIDDLQGDEIIVVATFLGAKIVTKYVTEHPNRISKLILFSFDPKPISAQPYIDKGAFEKSYKKALRYPSLGIKMFWETLFPDPSYQPLRDWGLKVSEKTPPEIFLKSHHNLSEEDVYPLIKKISIPTLMFNSGYYGDMNAPKNITWVQEYFSDSETPLSITVKSLFLNVYLPEKFNKTMEKFLNTT
jgi:sugar-specific transcriptional regulator TrmB/pimeloyl-ACP methyl ester carboxylesterase